MDRRQFTFATAATLAAGWGTLAQAQPAWPQRPVRWILSAPAGSGPDILARFVADQLSRQMAHPITIENRPGGSNVVGAQAAARAPADGHNFFFATTAAVVTNAYTFKALPYDPVKDFTPVRLVGRSPFIIAAATTYPAKDLNEVIARAKAAPGQVAIATDGPKTFSGMLADVVASMAGIQLNNIPYGTRPGAAIQDVISGRVQLVVMPHAALDSYLESGQLRALAVSTGKRLTELPNTPALSETFPGFEYTGWNGLFAPAGTPAEVVARVNRDLEAVLRQPDIAKRMLGMGSFVEPRMTVAEFDAFMKGERERWAALVKTLGIQPE